MGNKKHIDRIFQEKFKNFEQQPDAKNWDAIKARLQQKKQRRPFIIWWRAAGVAAVLAVVISLIIGNQNGKNVNYTAKDYIHFDYKPLEEDRSTVSKKVQNALSIDIDALSQDELKKPSISQNKKVLNNLSINLIHPIKIQQTKDFKALLI
jgi:negative regulator of sigma E activity